MKGEINLTIDGLVITLFFLLYKLPKTGFAYPIHGDHGNGDVVYAI